MVENRALTSGLTRKGRTLPAPSPPRDFQSALAAVTGTDVDLRAASNPPGGFFKLGTPGEEHWWSFSAFGTELFSVDLNTAALDAWATAIDTVEDIDHELFAGTYGLMNVKQLLDAETVTRDLAKTMADAVDGLKLIVSPLENDTGTISGSAVSVLLDQLHLIGDELHADEMSLTEHPTPAVAEALRAAGAALKTFGEQMAYVYWESNDILLNAVAVGANAISDNIQAYLRKSGLTSDSPQYQALATDPVAAVAEARRLIGGYSSTVIGDLPNNIPAISGDLSRPEVWAAANAAITTLIGVELDKLDVVARKVSAELKTAYDNASARLDAAGVDLPRQPLLLRALSPTQPGLVQPPQLAPVTDQTFVKSVNPDA